MPRNETNSKWYVPLVAGLETSRRSGALTTYDPRSLIGQLPTAPPWMLSGLVLWLDAAVTSSLKIMPDGGVYRWEDQSGLKNNATQPSASQRPFITTFTFTPRAVDFED